MAGFSVLKLLQLGLRHRALGVVAGIRDVFLGIADLERERFGIEAFQRNRLLGEDGQACPVHVSEAAAHEELLNTAANLGDDNAARLDGRHEGSMVLEDRELAISARDHDRHDRLRKQEPLG
jgi:hypothetical protein